MDRRDEEDGQARATGIQTASFSRRLAVSKSGIRAMMPPRTS